MDETRNEANDTGGPAQAATKAKAKRKSPARRPAAKSGLRKARKKAVAARRVPKKKAASLEGLLRDFSKRASKAGASIATISGGGYDSAKKAIGQASAASKSTIDRLTHEWRKMDAKKRAQFAAALLGALAAASAPIVRSSLKKK